MTTESPVIRRSFQVGRYTATLTVQPPRPGEPVHCSCEWSPRMPDRLTEAEIAAYVTGRDAALKQHSRLLGLPALVIDV